MGSLAARQIEMISEQWKANHLNAMACWEFGDLLLYCVEAFDRINREDEGYRQEVFNGNAEHSGEIEEAHGNFYVKWYSACKPFEATLANYQQDGHVVEYADRFLQCLRETEGILTDDATFFADDTLADLRDQAIDDHKKGETLDVDWSS